MSAKFAFVNVTNPSEAYLQKRKVRSHASRNTAARQQKVIEYQLAQEKLRKQRDYGHQMLLEPNAASIPCPSVLKAETFRPAHSQDKQRGYKYPFAKNGYELILIMQKTYAELEKTLPVMNALGAARSDPFDTLGRSLSRQESFLLDCFAQNVTVCNHICVNFPSPEAETDFRQQITQQWIQLAAADAGMMATVFLSACRNLQRLSGEDESDRYSTMAVYYKVETIRAINKALSLDGPISDNTLSMSLALSAEAAMLDDTVAAEQHLRAVERMVELRGGKSAEQENSSVSKMVVWFFKDPIPKTNQVRDP